METGIKSSFIPQDAATPRAIKSRSPTSFADLLILIAIVFLVASIALAAGVFLYLRFLQTSGASKLAQLERAKAAFEPSLIQELTRLDDRMQAADVVLRNHVAPSLFFHLLEQLTLQTVSFSTLDFQAADPQNMTIAMTGTAVSVNSIALQADYLSKSGTISSPIFSNIARQGDGVHFNLTAILNPLALRYANVAAGGQSIITPQAPPPEQPQQPPPADPFLQGGQGKEESKSKTPPPEEDLQL